MFALSSLLIVLVIITTALELRLCVAFTANRPTAGGSPTTVRLGSQSAAMSSEQVSCRVSRILPHVSPKEAQQAWLEHHWRRGGGLPVWIRSIHDGNIDERLVLPVGMKECILENDRKEDVDRTTIQYIVSDPGFVFGQHMIPNSHQGHVMFESLPTGGCRMIWKVDFETKQFQTLYQHMTDFAINTAATTIEEAVEEPRLLTLTTTLDGTDDPDTACREWIEFLWGRQGGGLFLPPTIPYGDRLPGMPESSTARESLLRTPSFVKETITSVSWSESNNKQRDYAEICYQLENPGWKSLPFLMHTHTARVLFRRLPASSSQPDRAAVAMEWEVQIRPYQCASSLVETLVAMAVSTIARNLKVHLTEPEAVVDLGLPRGYGGHKWGSVPKETWLGGVLHSHLSDRRSTLEQTVSLFQPWTWGRTGRGDADDDVQYRWSDGAIIGG